MTDIILSIIVISSPESIVSPEDRSTQVYSLSRLREVIYHFLKGINTLSSGSYEPQKLGQIASGVRIITLPVLRIYYGIVFLFLINILTPHCCPHTRFIDSSGGGRDFAKKSSSTDDVTAVREIGRKKKLLWVNTLKAPGFDAPELFAPARSETTVERKCNENY